MQGAVQEAVQGAVLSFDVGVQNVAYAVVRGEPESFELLDWRLLNLATGAVPLRAGLRCGCGAKAALRPAAGGDCCAPCFAGGGAGGADVTALKRELVRALGAIPLDGVAEVLVENQPALKNPKMKAIAETIFAYFLIAEVERGLPLRVRYVAAARKNALERHLRLDLTAEDRATFEQKSGYARNKAQAVAFCDALLRSRCRDGAAWRTRWRQLKKLDDMADALTQALCWMASRPQDR